MPAMSPKCYIGLDPALSSEASSASAIPVKTPAAAPSGSPTTIGTPRSPPSRISWTSGTWPRRTVPSLSAVAIPPPTPKRGCLLPGGIDEVAHVLGDAEERHVHLLEHEAALARHLGGRRLRGRDDDRAVQRKRLDERKLGVAGARGQVDQEHVQFAPFHVLDELLDGLHDHRPAPDDRRVVVDQEAHAHHLDAVLLHRDQDRRRALALDLRPALEARS